MPPYSPLHARAAVALLEATERAAAARPRGYTLCPDCGSTEVCHPVEPRTVPIASLVCGRVPDRIGVPGQRIGRGWYFVCAGCLRPLCVFLEEEVTP